MQRLCGLVISNFLRNCCRPFFTRVGLHVWVCNCKSALEISEMVLSDNWPLEMQKTLYKEQGK